MAMSVALPSFDAFLRSARRSPAVLPRTAPTFYRPIHDFRGYESPTTSSAYSSPCSLTPPGSPYYGHFVTLSPESSPSSDSDVAFDGWRLASSGSDVDDEPSSYADAATRYQDLLAQPCVAIAPRPRAVVSRSDAPARPMRLKKKYLKEKQRCEIVRRVRAGEKQAHLAKEFGVSRAAVCYLLKHEFDILRRSALRQQRKKLL